MPTDISHKLVIAISSRALFDLDESNAIYEKEGVEKYAEYQIKHENEVKARGGLCVRRILPYMTRTNADGSYTEEVREVVYFDGKEYMYSYWKNEPEKAVVFVARERTVKTGKIGDYWKDL